MPQPGSIDKGYVEIDAAGKQKPYHCEQAAKTIPLIPVSARRCVAQRIKIEMIAGGNHQTVEKDSFATKPHTFPRGEGGFKIGQTWPILKTDEERRALKVCNKPETYAKM